MFEEISCSSIYIGKKEQQGFATIKRVVSSMLHPYYGLLCVIYKNKNRIYVPAAKYVHIIQFSIKTDYKWM